MQIIRGEFEGPLRVVDALTVHGRLRAGAIVAPGAKLIFRGVAEGDIVVEPQGNAELWGVIEGSIYNTNGRVCVFGLVTGDVDTVGNAVTAVSHDSVVRGVQRQS
jgi:hypothetical protein